MLQESIAHLKQRSDGEWEIHRLDKHLMVVAESAYSMAVLFHSGDWAKLAGLWHDLGKSRPAFQKYIEGISGYNPEAYVKMRVDHSTAGAIYAVTELGDDVGRIFAYLIAGHHAGLPDWLPSDVSKQSALSCRLEDGKEKKYLEEALANNVSKDILSKKKLDTKPIGGSEGLLTSALFDQSQTKMRYKTSG